MRRQRQLLLKRTIGDLLVLAKLRLLLEEKVVIATFKKKSEFISKVSSPPPRSSSSPSLVDPRGQSHAELGPRATPLETSVLSASKRSIGQATRDFGSSHRHAWQVTQLLRLDTGISCPMRRTTHAHSVPPFFVPLYPHSTLTLHLRSIAGLTPRPTCLRRNAARIMCRSSIPALPLAAARGHSRTRR